MPLSHRVARFNRVVTNRLTRTFAGRAPGFGIVTHVGRRSGRVYRTPINVFRDGDDYRIALTYGPETDWVRNVLAAGGCELLTRGRWVRLTAPRLVTDRARRWAPPLVRHVLHLTGVTQDLCLSPLPASPKTSAQGASIAEPSGGDGDQPAK
jgi:deazaflavin-dependent oxidoreductase (nitroreductase family)